MEEIFFIVYPAIKVKNKTNDVLECTLNFMTSQVQFENKKYAICKEHDFYILTTHALPATPQARH